MAVFGTEPLSLMLGLVLLDASGTVRGVTFVALLAIVYEAKAIGAINLKILAIILIYQLRFFEYLMRFSISNRKEVRQLLLVQIKLNVHSVWQKFSSFLSKILI